ncbi:CD3324 family protein [Inconstantimicrobium mannanitabidum]|uniref:Uncharacterized protein n=1 Tax=Inconstantimicrobium mannanitabidum TaxID=1604901 RepID=A0ACB5RGE3_9CLOT|nr:CD3324 family protein [Clostridium sp. TW13]GKX68161.1 hypothetical protein rsdtw13_34190 [Clostridium sp. TW13]
MDYIKAQNVLPEHIVKIIQQYVDGGYIYIPRKEENHKAWGENSGTKESLKMRNNEIYIKYIEGMKIAELAKEYFLSEQSIRRVISKEKELFSRTLHKCL